MTLPTDRSAPTVAGSGFAGNVRILAGAVLVAPILIGVAVFFAARPPAGTAHHASAFALVVEVLLALAAASLVETVGYRTAALPATTAVQEVRSAAIARFQAAMMLRVGICEVVAFASVALTFAITPVYWLNYLTGGALSVLLLSLHVWPNARVISRSAAALDRAGVQSGLAGILTG